MPGSRRRPFLDRYPAAAPIAALTQTPVMQDGIDGPWKAMQALSTPRARSDVRVTAIPSSRRRAPSSTARARPTSDSSRGCDPVATPRSLSVVTECVSKKRRVATCGRHADESGASEYRRDVRAGRVRTPAGVPRARLTETMPFGQQPGPPATTRQINELLELLHAAGHDGFRDARGPMRFTQRQAAGKFSRAEADELIARLRATSDGAASADPPLRLSNAEQLLRRIPSDQLAGELQRRGWLVVEP